ncbi:MAG: GumC family protein, partial [Nitrosopumilus sp.]
MEKEKKVSLTDYLVLLVKWKKFLIYLLVPTLILTYLAIYFFVDEQYDAEVLIVPTGEEGMSGIASLMSNLDLNLPFSLGGTASPDLNIYSTIIYSRSNLEEVIEKYNLIENYGLSTDIKDYRKKAVEILYSNINASETDFLAYQIEVRANDPKLAADIANYIVELLNEKIVALKTEKSRNNRVFLEQRLAEVRENLHMAEDSLMHYQEYSGLISPEDQYKGIVEAYTEIESNLIMKRIQKSILEKIKGETSPEVTNLEYEISGIDNKLIDIKQKGEPAGILPPIKNLPEKAVNYFRLLREVEINSAILEFVLPLYEQSKIEEKKDIPTLQVIDYAVPYETKSYPPRLLFTLLITSTIFLFVFFAI